MMRHAQSRFPLCLLTVTVAVLLAAWTAFAPAASDKPLKIGIIQPLTGPNASAGQELLNAYKLAAKEQNAKGGILGRQIEIMAVDATNPQQGVSAAEGLINQGAEILGGTYISAVANAAIGAAAKKNILYWETNALAPNLTTQGLENIVRIGPNGGTFAAVAVEFMKTTVADRLGKKPGDLSVAVTHEQSIYGTSVGETEEKLLKELGAKVPTRLPYNPAAADLSDVVLRVQAANPDVWAISGYVADVILQLKTARQLNYRPRLIMLVASGDSAAFLDAMGEDGMADIPVASYPRYDINPRFGPGAKEFLAEYVKEYGKPPQFTQALTAYTGHKVMYMALQKAGSINPSDVRKAVSALDIPRGGQLPSSYGVKMNANFDNTRALPVVCQWRGKDCVTIYPGEAAAAGARLINVPMPAWKQ